MNAARIFPRMGLDVWRVPIADRYRRLTSQELDRLPEDIRVGASGTDGLFNDTSESSFKRRGRSGRLRSWCAKSSGSASACAKA
jgi:hypothetical protein